MDIRDIDFTESSVEGRINVWKKSADKFIRVTYKNEPDKIIIITAVKKKKGWGWTNMKIEYDKDADALYIQFKNAQVNDNIDIEEGVTVDLDSDKHIIGIEILDASKKLSLENISTITIANLPVETVAA